jgi:hypothetical protein
MAIIVFAGLVAVCGFFLYVLVQFRRDEKHPRRHEESPTGFPIVASGQIVGHCRTRTGIDLEPLRYKRAQAEAARGETFHDPCCAQN